MKKKIIILPIALILVLIIGVNVYLARNSSDKIDIQTTHLKERQIKNTVMIPGTLKLSDEQYIYFNAEKGDLDKINVTEGSIVQIGTPIITYNNDEITLEKDQNELGKESSQLRINSLTKQISTLNKKQEKLEKEMSKEEAADQIESERIQLNMDLETAKLDLKKANLEASSIERKTENLEVKSKIDGTVLEINKEASNTTNEAQKPLVHIGNINEYLASGVLSEYDALNVKIGQPVTITSDVLPNKKWTGTVKQIGYVPQQQQTTSEGTNDTANQYPIEVKIDDEDIKTIKPGFKVLLNIETDNKNASSLPIEAIVDKNGSKYVYILSNGKAIMKKVKVGETTDKHIEILSGISSKQQIILNPSNQITDGTEVNIND
ncbi:efflux RND transporter periplasmic adaptor subunit (plasmid) [Priestia megaterium]|uniref:efflux RND transporter periplasmic adaptor subunit n=1 Tax=Priestia megaterium TaxID=1404 RepID=UPI00244D1D64|nr:efflux RND transporter periplasmic adaptor subunit [Priestia megaterium]MDH2454868.1 efflux RND transporter periplasmic adaptor subunit [Priestia megaterium]MDL5154324.1 efflux RND transporter periplasmic adaptor subunit [Priestia megaterium]